jgi:hypothetical protein
LCQQKGFISPLSVDFDVQKSHIDDNNRLLFAQKRQREKNRKKVEKKC